MPWHISIALADGRAATADYREPIAEAMHRINRMLSEGRPGRPADYQAVAAWLDGHEQQSAACRAGLAPAGAYCGHD